MRKRARRRLSLSFVILCLLSATIAPYAFAVYDDTSENECIEESTEYSQAESDAIRVTEEYLTHAAYAAFCYEERGTLRYTLKSIITDTAEGPLSELIARALELGKEEDRWSFLNFRNDALSVDQNLQLAEDSITLQAFLNGSASVEYDYLIPHFRVDLCYAEGSAAVVCLYEKLDYKYSDLNDTSFSIFRYRVTLIQIDNKWYIAYVESDDDYYVTHFNISYDLSEEIRSIESAKLQPDKPSAACTSVGENRIHAINFTYRPSADLLPALQRLHRKPVLLGI